MARLLALHIWVRQLQPDIKEQPKYLYNYKILDGKGLPGIERVPGYPDPVG